ncbi:MAG: hypothetical protein R3321_12160 [Nitrososphaeraceae archaeon]|nr:hypothetical protein [Nitrososphaeraceae archaeon]
MEKLLKSVLICLLILQLNACYTPQIISKEELTQSVDNPGLVIKTKDQFEYSFEPKTYVITADSIIGKGSRILENGAIVNDYSVRRIGLDDIETVKQQEIDGVKTSLLVAGSVGLGVLLTLGLKSLMEDTANSIAQGVGQAINNIYP